MRKAFSSVVYIPLGERDWKQVNRQTYQLQGCECPEETLRVWCEGQETGWSDQFSCCGEQWVCEVVAFDLGLKGMRKHGGTT